MDLNEFEEDRIILDGELYSHQVPFNQLSGLIRKEKRTEQDLIDEKQIQFWIYDIVNEKGYEERVIQITTFIDDINIVSTPTFYIPKANHDDIVKLLKEAENAKFEGLMIRQIGIPYEHKRTWQLTKLKSWVDEEYKIVRFKKSITGDTLGSIWFENVEGERFYGVFNGTDVEQKEIWDNQEKYLGKYGTVKYQELTEGDKGVPRFGKCIKFRDKPGKD